MRPDADLMILDEASSQLDAHAQNDIFNKIAKSPNKKTLIYMWVSLLYLFCLRF